MYSSATAAMDVSSTSMNVASITAIAINQGLIGGAEDFAALAAEGWAVFFRRFAAGTRFVRPSL